MATKTSNNQVEQMSIEDMDFEALLKEEAEAKSRMEKISQAKKTRADGMKKEAFSEIEKAIQKYFDTVLTREEITQYLHDKEFIMPMVKESTAGKVGRVKVEDIDLLFYKQYKTDDGTRDMSLKLASFSKLPVPIGGAGKELKKLQEVTFESIKNNFKPKFWDFAKTKEGAIWVDLFFPTHKANIEAVIAEPATV